MPFNPEIVSLLSEAFGISSLIDASGGRTIEILEQPFEVHRTTYLGTPIIYPLLFKGQSYRYYKPNGEVATKILADFELPAVTLSTFYRSKNISETELTASEGEVDEMFGFGSYKIDIKGLCLAEKSHPQASSALSQLMKMKEYEGVAEAIPVISDIYQALGINAIVIKDINFEQLAGNPSVIPFRISAKSSQPKELLL